MFQRRHCDFLAATLSNSNCRANVAWEAIVNELTEALARENPNFQPRRFKEAGGKDQRPADEILNNVIQLRPASRIGNYGAGW
jgi:hypothetical protein